VISLKRLFHSRRSEKGKRREKREEREEKNGEEAWLY
jgi:hypothetical protein